jgi:hypothetical protein
LTNKKFIIYKKESKARTKKERLKKKDKNSNIWNLSNEKDLNMLLLGYFSYAKKLSAPLHNINRISENKETFVHHIETIVNWYFYYFSNDRIFKKTKNDTINRPQIREMKNLYHQ